MMEICFNNREADIGAFALRQLSGLDAAKLIERSRRSSQRLRARNRPTV